MLGDKKIVEITITNKIEVPIDFDDDEILEFIQDNPKDFLNDGMNYFLEEVE